MYEKSILNEEEETDFVLYVPFFINPNNLSLPRSCYQYSLIIDLNTIFYNLVRKHQAIGMTPAQASGIGSGLGHDKWLGLIRKAQSKDEKGIRENKQLQQLKDQWKKMGWANG